MFPFPHEKPVVWAAGRIGKCWGGPNFLERKIFDLYLLSGFAGLGSLFRFRLGLSRNHGLRAELNSFAEDFRCLTGFARRLIVILSGCKSSFHEDDLSFF